MTYNSRAKSEKSLRLDKEDMFTSMRNILGKDEVLDSNITAKPHPAPHSDKEHSEEKNNRVMRQAVARVSKLRKEQGLLRETLTSEFTTFKNMFLQLEDVMHVYENRMLESPEDKSSKVTSDLDPDFVKDIVAEAIGIEKYFAEMDRKKAGIMNQLSNK